MSGAEVSSKAARNAVRLLRALGDDKYNDIALLRSFFRWLMPRWEPFWALFRSDGTMSWKDFRVYVHWQHKWPGSAEKIFRLLDHDCEGVITAKSCHQTKRWFLRGCDMSDVGLADCRQKFASRYGSLGRAWRIALDPDDTNSCCFSVFTKHCHGIGIRRNLGKIWGQLTDGVMERPIHYRDLDPEGERLLTHFATALSNRANGSLREGWNAMCRDAGGQVKLAEFLHYCKSLHIDNEAARGLLATLDPHRREIKRCLTEFDRLCFLSRYAPDGLQEPETSTLGPFKSLGDLKRLNIDYGDTRNTDDDMPRPPRHPYHVLKDREPYEIILYLSKAEHDEYTRRVRNRMTTGGMELRPPQKEQEEAVELKFSAASNKLWDELMDGVSYPGSAKPRTPSTAAPTPSTAAPTPATPSLQFQPSTRK